MFCYFTDFFFSYLFYRSNLQHKYQSNVFLPSMMVHRTKTLWWKPCNRRHLKLFSSHRSMCTVVVVWVPETKSYLNSFSWHSNEWVKWRSNKRKNSLSLERIQFIYFSRVNHINILNVILLYEMYQMTVVITKRLQFI